MNSAWVFVVPCTEQHDIAHCPLLSQCDSASCSASPSCRGPLPLGPVAAVLSGASHPLSWYRSARVRGTFSLLSSHPEAGEQWCGQCGCPKEKPEVLPLRERWIFLPSWAEVAKMCSKKESCIREIVKKEKICASLPRERAGTFTQCFLQFITSPLLVVAFHSAWLTS